MSSTRKTLAPKLLKSHGEVPGLSSRKAMDTSPCERIRRRPEQMRWDPALWAIRVAEKEVEKKTASSRRTQCRVAIIPLI